LEYSSEDIPIESDNAHGEAVLHKPEHPFTSGWHYDDVRSWEVDRVEFGQNRMAEINVNIGDGCWIIKKGWDRLVVALVHNGEFGYEVDDRLFVWIVQE
jgi:hypothetical protein